MKIRRPYYNLMFSCTDQASRQHHWARRFKFRRIPYSWLSYEHATHDSQNAMCCRETLISGWMKGKWQPNQRWECCLRVALFEKRADFVIKACDPHVPSLKTNLSFSSVGKWRKSYFEYKHIIMINYIHTFNRLCCIFRLSHRSLWLPCMSFH